VERHQSTDHHFKNRWYKPILESEIKPDDSQKMITNWTIDRNIYINRLTETNSKNWQLQK